jgi:WD40 repeat protein
LRITFSDDGNSLMLVEGRTVHRVDVATGRLIHTNQLADSAPVIFSRDARTSISLGADQHIRVQDLDLDAPATIYATIRDECIAVSPDGRLLATGAWDGAVRLWDAQPEPARDDWAFLKQPGTKRLALDGRRLIAFQWQTNNTAGAVSTAIGMWDVPSGKALADFSVNGPKVRDATPVWPGNHLAMLREDHSVEIWQPDGPELKARFPLVPATIHPETIDYPILFAFDEGRRLLAVHGSGDNTIWVAEDQLGPLGFYWFDVPQRRLSSSSSIRPGIRVTCGDCSRDGHLIALGGFGGEVLVIDVANGTSVRTLTGRHQKWVMDVEFSPDDRFMATAGNEGFVRLWETASWREIGTHRIHGSSAMSLAFHPSARRLVVGTIGTISILETNGLRPLTTIPGPASHGVTRLRFLNEDTLVGWIGGWRPHASDTMTVWPAPSFEGIASIEQP